MFDEFPSEFLTVAECARALNGAGKRPIYAAIELGELRAIRLNGRGDLRVHKSWFRDWIQRRSMALRQQATALEQAASL